VKTGKQELDDAKHVSNSRPAGTSGVERFGCNVQYSYIRKLVTLSIARIPAVGAVTGVAGIPAVDVVGGNRSSRYICCGCCR
jgi:hypothetical protein